MSKLNKICTHRLKNFGLRITATSIAQERRAPRCSCSGNNSKGFYLDNDTLYELMTNFFVAGTVPPSIGGFAPVYEFNNYHYPGAVEFATELDEDVKLLEAQLKVGIYHYGPPLWRLGLTEHYQTLVDKESTETEINSIWDEVISRCYQQKLIPGEHVFRARIGDSIPPATGEQFDSPDPNSAFQGRFNTGEAVFYGSLDIETCLHETRATLEDYISLAKFIVTKPLNILNLTKINDKKITSPFDSIEVFINKLSYSGKDEYDLCREFAKKIKDKRFDGLIIKSYYGQAHTEELYNLILFGHPFRDGKLRLESVNRLLLKSIKYEYEFGPSNDTYIPLTDDERKKTSKIDGLLTEGYSEENVKRIDALVEEFKNLHNRKSDKPI